MNAAAVVADLLDQSGLTKSGLAGASGVSRALLDEYLKGARQPSLGQVARLAAAAGVDLEISVRPKPKPVPAEFIAVLEFGDLFPRRDPEPLIDIGPLWRRAEELRHG